MTSKANFLLLDEPTNHLDIHSNELLIEALNRYQGSFILVSHDRYFISKTANKIWEIVDKKVRVFKGTYEEWVDWKQRMEAREKEKPTAPRQQPQVKEAVKKESSNNRSTNKTPLAELQKQQKLFSQVEKQMADLNKEKQEIELKLSDPDTYSNPEAFKKTESLYKQVNEKLAEINKRYEAAFEKLMDMENN